jgi:hypothetical protein
MHYPCISIANASTDCWWGAREFTGGNSSAIGCGPCSPKLNGLSQYYDQPQQSID